MGVWLGPMGKPKAKLPPVFRLFIGNGTYGYTREDFLEVNNANHYISGVGAYREEKDEATGRMNWTLAIYGSGRLVFHKVVDKVDLFIVGGGVNGKGTEDADYVDNSDPNNPVFHGGNGGAGGKILTKLAQDISENVSYTVSIGAGNNAQNSSQTSFGSYNSGSGTQASGGVGARINFTGSIKVQATNGGAGETAFGDNVTEVYPDYVYGNGGGAGGVQVENITGYTSASGGGSSTAPSGGNSPDQDGGNAIINTGDGGGGAGFKCADYDPERHVWWTWTYGAGGTGAAGLVMIRNAR